MADPLVAFAKWAIGEAFEGLDLDGGDIQDRAVKLGLLDRVEYDPEVHGDNDVDAEKGDPWFVFAGPLAGFPGASYADWERPSTPLEKQTGERPWHAGDPPENWTLRDEEALAKRTYQRPSPEGLHAQKLREETSWESIAELLGGELQAAHAHVEKQAKTIEHLAGQIPDPEQKYASFAVPPDPPLASCVHIGERGEFCSAYGEVLR